MKPDKIEEKRSLILDAAALIFAEKGYHAANIADIAQKLGMGHGTFYRYYENKLDIFKHVVAHVVTRVATTVSSESPTAANDLAAYRGQVERIADGLLDLFLAEKHVAKLLFVEAVGIDSELNAQLDAAYEIFADTTEVYLKNGVKKRFLRNDLDTATTARAINAMIFECVRRAASAHDSKKTAKVWTRAVVNLLFDGIGV